MGPCQGRLVGTARVSLFQYHAKSWRRRKKNGRSARPRVAKVRERFLNKDISSVLFFQCQKHTSPLSIESKPHFLSSFLNVFLLQDNFSYFFWKG